MQNTLTNDGNDYVFHMPCGFRFNMSRLGMLCQPMFSISASTLQNSGDWHSWGACNACGGERSRRRQILIYAKNGGRPCPQADMAEVKACPHACDTQFTCSWASWEQWGKCSMSCGVGSQRKRVRHMVRLPSPAEYNQISQYGLSPSDYNALTNGYGHRDKAPHGAPLAQVHHSNLLEKYNRLARKSELLGRSAWPGSRGGICGRLHEHVGSAGPGCPPQLWSLWPLRVQSSQNQLPVAQQSGRIAAVGCRGSLHVSMKAVGAQAFSLSIRKFRKPICQSCNWRLETTVSPAPRGGRHGPWW